MSTDLIRDVDLHVLSCETVNLEVWSKLALQGKQLNCGLEDGA